jgi:flagellar biosynthesis chaperone FliJ
MPAPLALLLAAAPASPPVSAIALILMALPYPFIKIDEFFTRLGESAEQDRLSKDAKASLARQQQLLNQRQSTAESLAHQARQSVSTTIDAIGCLNAEENRAAALVSDAASKVQNAATTLESVTSKHQAIPAEVHQELQADLVRHEALVEQIKKLTNQFDAVSKSLEEKQSIIDAQQVELTALKSLSMRREAKIQDIDGQIKILIQQTTEQSATIVLLQQQKTKLISRVEVMASEMQHLLSPDANKDHTRSASQYFFK